VSFSSTSGPLPKTACGRLLTGIEFDLGRDATPTQRRVFGSRRAGPKAPRVARTSGRGVNSHVVGESMLSGK